jgi:hypothetical protein
MGEYVEDVRAYYFKSGKKEKGKTYYSGALMEVGRQTGGGRKDSQNLIDLGNSIFYGIRFSL